jgi:signal transduction histidine kinase
MALINKLGSVQNFECETFRKDGSRLWLSMSGRTIIQDGISVRYEGMCEDVTERNLLRAQLLQAQKLESVGQLAAGIAHEINTPTQYIGDNVRFMKDAFLDLRSLLAHYERLLLLAKSNTLTTESIHEIEEAVRSADAGYLLEEIPKAVEQTLEGVTRVSTIVSAMKSSPIRAQRKRSRST